MKEEQKYDVVVVSLSDETDKQVIAKAVSERKAETIERGLIRNLDGERFFVDVCKTKTEFGEP